MKNRVGIALCTLLLGLTAWGCSPAVQPENLGMIQPGVGIKDLTIAQTREEVEKTWGSPDDVYENPFDKSNVIVAYHQKGIEVSYRNGSVDCVNLYPEKKEWKSYAGATQGGVWVNSSEKDVRQLLGKPVEEAPQALNYPGLTVFIADGKVDYLTVVAQGTATKN